MGFRKSVFSLLILVFAVDLLSGCQSASKKTVSEIPVEDFFRNPSMVAASVSTDGKSILVLKPWKKRF